MIHQVSKRTLLSYVVQFRFWKSRSVCRSIRQHYSLDLANGFSCLSAVKNDSKLSHLSSEELSKPSKLSEKRRFGCRFLRLLHFNTEELLLRRKDFKKLRLGKVVWTQSYFSAAIAFAAAIGKDGIGFSIGGRRWRWTWRGEGCCKSLGCTIER